MWTFVGAATGLPSILFTAALVVVVCFWLLVAVGATTASSFDSDVDLDAWGIGGVPVSVSPSLVTVFSWFLTVGSTALLVALTSSGAVTAVLRLIAPTAALFMAWWLTRRSVRPLRRLRPDEPGFGAPPA
ncbi:hypothetical protein [Streptomyces sp. NPDC005731]|uniref:hypothetical protein n=1 Tax=Streptomyces sp. NPDC005731 TaxID=3157056 RepID=UPI0033DE37B8